MVDNINSDHYKSHKIQEKMDSDLYCTNTQCLKRDTCIHAEAYNRGKRFIFIIDKPCGYYQCKHPVFRVFVSFGYWQCHECLEKIAMKRGRNEQ